MNRQKGDPGDLAGHFERGHPLDQEIEDGKIDR